MNDVNEPPSGLLGIGAFSALVRLSVRMLRYYDQQAVLRPAYTDPASGYRYYTGDQVRDAVLVRSLRDVGFSVAAIAAITPRARDHTYLSAMLAAHRDELGAQSAVIDRQLFDLGRLTAALTTDLKEPAMVDIEVRTIEPRTIIALRGVIPTYADEGQLWERFLPLAMRCSLPRRPSVGGSTFFDEGFQEQNVDVETWVGIDAPIGVEPPLTCRQIGEHRAAVATVYGDYSGIGPACADLASYLSDNELAQTGVMSNVYLIGTEQTSNPAEYVTEIHIPV